MKDKAIELFDKLEQTLNKDFEHIGDIAHVKSYIIKTMLEFGYYVAEEQKKQCLKEARLQQFEYGLDKEPTLHNGVYSLSGNWVDINEESILNSKNVCEQ